MRKLLLAGLMIAVAQQAVAQVDIERRRTLLAQVGVSATGGDEMPFPAAYFWFNENNFPCTNTALRFIFGGVFANAELSWFPGNQTNTAIGVGFTGGLFVDSVVPYRAGARLSDQQFYGDIVSGSVFINQTIPNPPPLPINVRATYSATGSFYREADDTQNFTLPADTLTQTISAELRLGGIVPGLTAKRGAELYVAADVSYRSGFEQFGPVGSPFPAHNKYERVFGSLAGKIPVGETIISARVCGGLGEHLDELTAWKLGGNLLGADSYSLPLHGYYTREIFADDFGLANLAVTIPVNEDWRLAGHLYGDYAAAKTLNVATGLADGWHHFVGVGAGVSFRALWNINGLLSYGYGVNAIREGRHGGHEVALALEKQF
jgi:hypothetical protein